MKRRLVTEEFWMIWLTELFKLRQCREISTQIENSQTFIHRLYQLSVVMEMYTSALSFDKTESCNL